MSNRHAVSATALSTLPVFQGLEIGQLEEIARHAGMRRVARGVAVVQAGEATDNVYFVLNGSMKVLVSDEDGREVIFTIIGQGAVFGEMGMLDAAPRSASVVSAMPSDLVVFSQADFLNIMKTYFDVCLRVMGNLAQRLREADRKIESLALMDVYGRVARLLLDLGEQVDGKCVIRKKISKQDIAKMIGASREMVSRVMKDLIARGLIEECANGHLVLLEQIDAL
ncbi:Crp/Fnr family transcriptional regulator [Uliginosibacterium sp. 31-16]|uniref:Crp/Fnr family transcriptional regulator n=1 Tax=Uliginosibacterium sp. 31-16 TaxID=3068315 RepID=UPI00273F9E9A|nr:Crp/Fnr family transcriptional regulator [Uliginosibacterium sp. 31-16]MDP5239979.1 Crp/Fnr family transcriptional regulator [Uliginosibacterium sp. 31-16]